MWSQPFFDKGDRCVAENDDCADCQDRRPELPGAVAERSGPAGNGSVPQYKVRRLWPTPGRAAPKGVSVVSSTVFTDSGNRSGTYQLSASSRPTSPRISTMPRCRVDSCGASCKASTAQAVGGRWPEVTACCDRNGRCRCYGYRTTGAEFRSCCRRFVRAVSASGADHPWTVTFNRCAASPSPSDSMLGTGCPVNRRPRDSGGLAGPASAMALATGFAVARAR